MRKYLKKGCVLCMALILVLGSMTAAFAAPAGGGGTGAAGGGTGGTSTAPTTPTTDITVTGYTVTASSITKGTTFNAEVKISDIGHKGSNIGPGDIYVSHVADSFSLDLANEKISITVSNPTSNGPLTATILIEDLVYSGVGNSLKLLVGVKDSYQKKCRSYLFMNARNTPSRR